MEWIVEAEFKADIVDGYGLIGEELVRCKDCKNWETSWQNERAKNYHYCPFIDGIRRGDWYCADGERKEE